MEVLPSQHIGRIKESIGDVVYITDCVWAAVYRNVAENSARNRLHPGTQSDVDGEQQRLEPIKNALRDLQRWALHIEDIWHRSVLKPRSKVRACRKKCRQTDRQTAFRLYIVKCKCIVIFNDHICWFACGRTKAKISI